MLKHPYRGLVMAFGNLGLDLATWAGPGYLATKGPVPLRFLPVPQEPKVTPQVVASPAPPVPATTVSTVTAVSNAPGDLSYILAAPEPFPAPMMQLPWTVQAAPA